MRYLPLERTSLPSGAIEWESENGLSMSFSIESHRKLNMESIILLSKTTRYLIPGILLFASNLTIADPTLECRGIYKSDNEPDPFNYQHVLGSGLTSGCSNNLQAKLDACDVSDDDDAIVLNAGNSGNTACYIAILLNTGVSCPSGDAALPNSKCATCPEDAIKVTIGNDTKCVARPNCKPAVGGPIRVRTGEKVMSVTDYIGMGANPLRWGRTYNHLKGGWRFSFSGFMEQPWDGNANQPIHTTANNLEAVFQQDNGERIYFYEQEAGEWLTYSNENFRINGSPSSVRYPDNTVDHFNSDGQLTKRVTPHGFETTFTYDANDKLDTITNETGREIDIDWTSGRISSMTDPAGNVIEYDYDTNGNLQYVTYPDNDTDDENNPQIEYKYDATTDYLTGIVDEAGVQYATYTYDGDRAKTTELAGEVEKFTVDLNTTTEIVTVTNALDKDTEYMFGDYGPTDVDGLSSALCDPTTTAVSYDSNGFVETKTDENGVVTTYDYDTDGKLKSTIEDDGTPSSSHEQLMTTYTWDSNHRLPATVTKGEQKITVVYESSSDPRVKTRTISSD